MKSIQATLEFQDDSRVEQGEGHHLIPFFKNSKLNSITVKDVEKFKIEAANKVSLKTANYGIRILRSMLQKAIMYKYINYNPALEVQKYKVNRKKYYVLDKYEFQKLMNVLEDQANRAHYKESMQTFESYLLN